MDVLADVLSVSGVRGAVGARIAAGSGWVLWWKDVPGAAIHAVTAGVVWLGLPDRPPVELLPGDVVLLPTGTDHSLAADREAAARPCDMTVARRARGEGQELRFGAGPVRSRSLCALYEYEPDVSVRVLAGLPDVVHLRGDAGGRRLDDTVRLLAAELAHPQLATAVVLDHLVDILLIQVLRARLAADPAPGAGVGAGAVRDPLVGEALERLHADPGRAWTTAALAAEVHVSRATLARRFPAAVGHAPHEYLTLWRMDLAARRLRTTDDALDAVARAVGYTSVYAFSRAFSRLRGSAPGRYRTASRAPDGRGPVPRFDFRIDAPGPDPAT